MFHLVFLLFVNTMDDDEDFDPHFYQIQFKLTCPYQSFVQILNQMYVDF
jgi:hypothetical protein